MESRKELECYDLKFFGGIEFYDYCNLKANPLYISVTNAEAPYIKMEEILFKNAEKVSSLSGIVNYLRKNERLRNDIGVKLLHTFKRS